MIQIVRYNEYVWPHTLKEENLIMNSNKYFDFILWNSKRKHPKIPNDCQTKQMSCKVTKKNLRKINVKIFKQASKQYSMKNITAWVQKKNQNVKTNSNEKIYNSTSLFIENNGKELLQQSRSWIILRLKQGENSATSL